MVQLARIKTDQDATRGEANCFGPMAMNALFQVSELTVEQSVIAQDIREHPGFFWADKVVLFAACVLWFLLALFWLLAFLIIGSLGAKHLWNYMGVQSIALSLLFAGLVLIVLRGIDFVMGGPTYRHFVASKCCVNSIAAELHARNR